MKPATTPITPFMNAKTEWDTRFGMTVVQAKNWRLAFFGMLVTSFIVSGALVLEIQKKTVVPILVGLDKERGEAVVLGPADKIPYKPNLLEIKYFLSQFIRSVRAVPADPVVLKQNWLRAYAYLRKESAGLLNEITSSDADSPLKKVGDLTVIPQPLSVVQVPGSDAFQAHWKETVFDKNGLKIDEYNMMGIFSIEVEPPTSEKLLSENPLGLFITSFQWNRELSH